MRPLLPSLQPVPPAIRNRLSTLACSPVRHATSVTPPLPGALPHSPCRILPALVKITVSTMKRQPAVIATPSTFPRLPASNATIATIPPMREATTKSDQLCSEYQAYIPYRRVLPPDQFFRSHRISSNHVSQIGRAHV